MSEKAWSHDKENFCHTSLGDLLASYDLKVGDTVYVGDLYRPTPADLIDADDVIETLACRGSDLGGEWAEDFPDVTKEAEAELQALLHAWVAKHCEINFWQVTNTQTYTLTAEDFGGSPEGEGSAHE